MGMGLGQLGGIGRLGLPTRKGGGVASAGPLAIGSQMVTSGNSWASSFISYTGANDNRALRWGGLTALMEYIKSPWRITRLGHKAVSGTTSTQIVTQTTNAIATLSGSPTDGVWICTERFLNDVGTGKTAVQAAADYDTDIAAARAANLRCIIGTCPPQKPSAGAPWTAPQLAKIAAFNVLVRAKAGKYVKVIDYDLMSLVDADYADDLHLKTNGWDKVAAYIVSSGLLTDWLPTGAIKDVVSTEYTDNRDMTGGNTTAPLGWTRDLSNAGGCTTTWDTATKRLTISGNPGGASKYVEFNRVTGNAPLPAVADNLELILDYTIIGTPTGLLDVMGNGVIYTSGFATLNYTLGDLYLPGVAETAVGMVRAAGNYVTRTPQVPVASGTPFYRYTVLQIHLENIASIDITIQFDFVGYRKVA